MSIPHEPCRESPLFGLPNAVLSPHLGGSSEEALRAVGEMISSSVLASLAGQAVPNAVNLPSGVTAGSRAAASDNGGWGGGSCAGGIAAIAACVVPGNGEWLRAGRCGGACLRERR